MFLNINLFIIGLCMGSFLNCLEYRYINHLPLLLDRSKCDKCSHVLNIFDLIPVVSWIRLKGKCRYCGNTISIRYPLSELICGIGYTLIFLKYSLSNYFFIYLILFSCLFYISLVDFDIYEIPEWCLIVCLISWIMLNIKICNLMHLVYAVTIAGYVYLLSLVMKKILKKDCFGFGDIKLIFIIGLFLGLHKTIWCLLLACIIGIFIILINKKEMIPFGPALSISCFILLTI